VTGFGQTGPWASLPSHGLNMDALGDTLNVEWVDGQPELGWTYISWGNDLGAADAAMAVCAALVAVRTTGQGAWIDASCWDSLVATHRTELAMSMVTGVGVSAHRNPRMGPFYNTYLSSDGNPVLLGTLERKFWERFCVNVGRPDLVDWHRGGQIDFANHDDGTLRRELISIFAMATSAEWLERFITWDVPGGPVLDVPAIMQTDHYASRGIVGGEIGEWPNVLSTVRWHHADERAGTGLRPPPALDADRASVLSEWLGVAPDVGV
jgi:alpha-methylacyl-CoA racemase